MIEFHDPAGRCAGCPRAPGARCAGAVTPRLCVLVDPTSPDYEPAYLTALEPPAAPAAPRRPVAESLRLLREMRSCPHRSERTDCGCDGAASCSLGLGRDGLVRIADCFDCLAPPPS